MATKHIITILAASTLSLFTVNVAAEDKMEVVQTAIVSQADAEKTQFDGSVFYTYYAGETVGTKDAVTGVAVIEPGHEIHPPHEHAEEEYLMIIEGTGEWTVNDKVMPAKTGDILYAAPWDLHGVINTGKTPLKFVVMKWSSKGVEPPVAPK